MIHIYVNRSEYYTQLFSRLLAVDVSQFNDKDLFKTFIQYGNSEGDIWHKFSYVTVQMMAGAWKEME